MKPRRSQTPSWASTSVIRESSRLDEQDEEEEEANVEVEVQKELQDAESSKDTGAMDCQPSGSAGQVGVAARTTTTTAAAAVAAATGGSCIQDLSVSSSPGVLTYADSDVPAPAATATPSTQLLRRFPAAGPIAMRAAWMQPDPLHPASPFATLAHQTTCTPASSSAAAAMGHWDSIHSYDLQQQQQHMAPFDLGTRGTPLKRGRQASCDGESLSCQSRQRRCAKPFADVVTAAAAAATSTATAAASTAAAAASSSAWMLRAGRELGGLLTELGLMGEYAPWGAPEPPTSAHRSYGPLRLPDARPKRDLSALLLRGLPPISSRASGSSEALAAPATAPYQALAQQPRNERRWPCGTNGTNAHSGLVKIEEIESIDSIPFEALL